MAFKRVTIAGTPTKLSFDKRHDELGLQLSFPDGSNIGSTVYCILT